MLTTLQDNSYAVNPEGTITVAGNLNAVDGIKLRAADISLEEKAVLRTENGLDFSKLVNINNNVIFVPKAASLLPSDFAWQGYLLGKMTGNEIMPLPRLRSLMPEVDECPVDLNLEDTATIRQLLAGNSLQTSLPSGWAGLYYKNVPLALLRIRNGRALWVER